MVRIIKKNLLGVRYTQIWFAEIIDIRDSLKFVRYIQAINNVNLKTFKKNIKYTLLINLNLDENEIFKDFRKNYRNEIRKALRSGCKVEKESDLNRFVKFYNDFSLSKNLNKIKLNDVLNENIIVTKAIIDNKILSYHAYIIDREIKRVRLLYSPNLLHRLSDKREKKLISAVNKCHHWLDIRYFKDEGYTIYDFGGIAKKSELKGIDDFKLGFGGDVVNEWDYISFPVYILEKLFKSILK